MRLLLHLRSACLIALLAASASPAQTSSAPPPAAPPAPATAPAQPPAPIPEPNLESSPAPSPKTSAAELPPVSRRHQRSAEDAYLAGARQLDRNDPAAAEKSFARAVALNPLNPDYPLALAVAREHRLTQLVQQASRQHLLGHTTEADALLAEARPLDPGNRILAQHFDFLSPQLDAAIPHEPSALPPVPYLAGAIELRPTTTPQSLHLHTDVQNLIRSVAASYGIHCVFDPSVAPQSIRLDLDNVTYAQAMPILQRMAHVFAVPLDPTTILIAKDTEANRQRLEPLLLETLNIPGQSSEEMNSLVSLVRNIFDVKQASVQPNLDALVLRAPAETLQAVNRTLADLLDGGSEVMIEAKLYDVDTTRTLNLGLNLPQSAGAYSVPGVAEAGVAANQTAVNQAIASGVLVLSGNPIQNLVQESLFLVAAGLLNSTQIANTLVFLGGGITTTGLFLGSGATANFALNSSDSTVLDDIQVRVFDRQDAVFRTGTRYPIATAIYSSSVPALPSSLAGATINGVSVSSLLNQISGAATSIPQFQYEDLGLTLKATPVIQKSGLITLNLDMKIEALAGASLNNIPVLDSQQLTSSITVADGATAMLVSSMSRSESNAVSGIPGLSEVPGFQSTTDDNSTVTTDRLVVLITPHIVRRRSSTIVGPRIALTPHPIGTSE